MTDNKSIRRPMFRAAAVSLVAFAALALAVSAGAPPRAFSNATQITIPAASAATPYPSQINVSGQVGKITDVDMTIRNFSMPFSNGADILLAAPDGSNAIVMSDVWGETASNVTFELDDEAAEILGGSPRSGSFRPQNVQASNEPEIDFFPSPAPTPNGNTALSLFDGKNPNGAWKLYVRSDSGSSPGSIAGGWSLDIEVKPPAPCTIGGTNGNDVLRGTPGRDVICGFGGDDVIYGMGGNDILIGGSGNDTILGGPGNDLIFGQGGNDLLFGEGGNDRLRGGGGADRLRGGAGNDDLRGQAGDDNILAGDGDDLVFGGTGNDFLAGQSGVGKLYGEAGNDTLNVRDGASGDLANGGGGNDRCASDSGDRKVFCER